jgi:hypothetical protein
MHHDHLLYEPYPNAALLDGWLESTNSLTRSILENMRPGDESVEINPVLNPPALGVRSPHLVP